MGNDDQRNSPIEKDKYHASGEVNTGGGLYVSGDIVTEGGDFVGHDKHVHGDEVSGDKVMGNKVVIHEAPKQRIPLERPPRAAHFQDRKEALAQLITDLHPGQIVTLCGPGGIGKSALGAEAVWQLAPNSDPPDRFPDGIVYHSFYNQPQAALALEHIARSFGEEIKPSPKEAAQRALAGRRALLILDGTEQADDVRMVIDIHNQCGVLITSQKRQDALDKRLDVVPLPPEDGVALLQAWGGSRAFDLIAVSRITELVGRLPLALRLVGRYLAHNEENASDYLTWLEETPLSALDQGERREQSVRLLLARSLEQVSEMARRVLGIVGLLAVSPFSREPVATALQLSTDATRQAFGELVNYGLLLRHTENYEVSHALIHTYARLQLVSPTDKEVERLAAYYTSFLQEHPSKFPLLNQFRPHVLALLHIGHERQAWVIVSSLASVIDNYLDLQGYWTDRIMAITLNIAAAQGTQNRRDEGNLLGNLGNAYANLGQIPEAIDYYEQALAISQEIGDRRNEGTWLGNLGNTYANLGQTLQAIDYYEQALAISQEIGDRRNEGTWLGNLGGAYRNMWQIPKAIDYYEQALVISQEIGDRRGEGSRLGNLGLAYYNMERISEAIDYYEQALVIFQEIGDRQGEGNQLGNLGLAYHVLSVTYRELEVTYHDSGLVRKAIDYYEQALVIFQEIGDRQGEGNQLGNLGLAYHALSVTYRELEVTYHDSGLVKKAIDYYEQALVIFQEIGDRRGEGNQLGKLGWAYYDSGQIPEAIKYYKQALVISQEIGDRQGEGTWLGKLGWAYASLGRFEQADGLYKEALIISRAIGDRQSEGTWLGKLGQVYVAHGQFKQARQLWLLALQIFSQIGSPDAKTIGRWLDVLEQRGREEY